MNTKSVPSPINTRLASNTKLRLKKLATACGVTTSDLVRAALYQKIPAWEKRGVILLIKKS